MVGADLVIGRMVDGVPVVGDYKATDHAYPQADEVNNVQMVEFGQSGGKTRMVMERPLAATEPQDNSIPETGRVVFIVARGLNNELTTGGHG